MDIKELIGDILEGCNKEAISDCDYERQGRLCQQLLERLRAKAGINKDSNSDNNNDDDDSSDDEKQDADFLNKRGKNPIAGRQENATIRSLLGNLPSHKISKLVSVVIELMAHRSVIENPLSQQDVEEAGDTGLEDATTKAALSHTSLTAANLYAFLVGRPGALAAGFVEMTALSALATIFRIWRETMAKGNIPGRRAGQALSRNNKTSETQQSRVVTAKRSLGRSVQPVKRKRKTLNDLARDASDDDEDDDDLSACQEKPEEHAFLSFQIMRRMGLQVAFDIAALPLNRDFINWCPEAREVILEVVSMVLGTAAALLSSPSQSMRQATFAVDAETKRYAQRVVDCASPALVYCILEPDAIDSNDEEDDTCGLNDREAVEKRHETIVFIMRGLMPMLNRKDIQPNGDNGKQAAATTVSQTLSELIREVAYDVQSRKHRWPRSMMELVQTSTPTTPGPSAYATPKTARQRRQSVGSARRRSSLSAMPTPALKSAKTPARSAGGSGRSSSPRPVLTVFVGALQRLATDKSLERSACRATLLSTLQACIPSLPWQERSHFLRFVVRLCHSKMPSQRHLACELIGALLVQHVWLWREHATDSQVSPRRQSMTPTTGLRLSLDSVAQTIESECITSALWHALSGRLQDRVSAIRTASCVCISQVFTFLQRPVSSSDARSASIAVTEGLREMIAPSVDDVAESLRVLASDDKKATVRKVAVGTIVDLFLLASSSSSFASPPIIEQDDLSIFRERCRDESTLTREAAAEALTRWMVGTVATNHGVEGVEALQQVWVSSVLPMVLDSEIRCAARATEFVHQVLVKPLLDHQSSDIDCEGSVDLAWSILANIEQHGPSRLITEAWRKSLSNLVDTADSSTSLVKRLLKLIEKEATMGEEQTQAMVTDRQSGVWCLFEALGHSSKAMAITVRAVKRRDVDLSFLMSSWEKMLRLSKDHDLPRGVVDRLRCSMRNALRVMSKIAPCIDSDMVAQTHVRLHKMLSSFELPPDIIGPAITALITCTLSSRRDASLSEHRSNCKVWIRELYQACHEEMERRIHCTFNTEDKTVLIRAMFTAGEVSLVGFNATDDERSPNSDNDLAKSASDDPAECIIGLHVRPDQLLVEMVQIFLPSEIPGSVTVHKTPSSVRAHAFTALGKLCLRNEGLAKSSLNILARELHENMVQGEDASATVQSNALLVIGDLCVRFTTMADRYLPSMAACLQSGVSNIAENVMAEPADDNFALVRKHAVILLSSLIVQDYIKWRGLLFHRFLVASADEDEEVASLATAALCGPLLAKQPKLFANQVVETLFVLNRCQAHPMYTAAASFGDGGSGIAVGFDGINLTGELGRIRRMRMYDTMLSHVTDVQKIELMARIAKEILASALVEGSDLNRACAVKPSSDMSSLESPLEVMRDAFAVLRSPSMRVGKITSSEDGEQDNQETRNKLRLGRLMSSIGKKETIQYILPILRQLKALFEQSQSGLLKELMAYFVDVYRMYKTEVQECLATSDATLLQEIEYDARRARLPEPRPSAENSFEASYLSSSYVSQQTFQ